MDAEGQRGVFTIAAAKADRNRLGRHGLVKIQWTCSMQLQAQRVSVGRPIATLW